MPETLFSDIPLSDTTTCRILTISSSLEQAISFINRIQGLDSGSPTAIEQVQSRSLLTPSSNSLGSSPSQAVIKIPWTISNKYYVADVHFEAHEIKELTSHHAQSVPAVIFVWAHGEPYKDHIQCLSRDLTGHDPEVSLAVRIRNASSMSSAEPPDMVEDESEIDEFLSSHGFEFIDAAEGRDDRPALEDQEEGAFSDGIPRLPRVIDALSTIMWPSMQAQSRPTTKPKTAAQERERGGLLDWASASQDNSYSTVEELVTRSNSSLTNHGQMQKEMEQLARWLEDDESLREDPWKTAANSGAMSMSPTVVEGFHFPMVGAKEQSGVESGDEFGFDDDFTVFVSAPPLHPDAVESALSTRNDSFEAGDASFDTSFEADRLVPTQHAGPLYKSLGSVSDFGGSEDGKVESEDEEEKYLPTEEEIRATSTRIFGAAGLSSPPSLMRTHTARPLPLPSESQSQTSPSDEDTYDMAPFDLAQVLSALQRMKAEIASMEDEGERRRAAAKVALGLVYGLEADAGVNLEAEGL